MHKSPSFTLNSAKKNYTAKKIDIFQQIVKLTKQNQYLNTKVDCLYQQLQNMIDLKDKYKKKYKELKSNQNQRKLRMDKLKTMKNIQRQDTNQPPSTRSDLYDPKSLENIEDPYKLAHNNFIQNNATVDSLNKINNAITNINEQIQALTLSIQPLKCPEIWKKIVELAQNLHQVASMQGQSARQRSSSIQINNNNQRYGIMSEFNLHIPVKETRQLDHLKQMRKSRSQKSVQHERLKNGRICRQRAISESSNKNKQSWKLLKEIGKQLKNWKFFPSQTSREED